MARTSLLATQRHRNWGSFCTPAGAVATIDLRVSSGGSNLATTGNGTTSASPGRGLQGLLGHSTATSTPTGGRATRPASSQWIKWDFGAGSRKDINYVA